MHAITRNSSTKTRGKELLTFFGGQVFLSFKDARELLGYSSKTGNKVIMSKVSEENIIKKCKFTKSGSKVITYYLNTAGIEQLISSITQKDKIQNGILAIDMINNAVAEIAKDVYGIDC